MRQPARVLGLCVAVVVGLGAMTPATAQAGRPDKARRGDIAAQLRTLREQVSEASEAEAALLDQLDEVQAERQALDGRVSALERRLAVVVGEADAAEAHLEGMQGQFVRTQTQLGEATNRLAVERGVLRARAVNAYMGRPNTTPTEVMLRAASLREVAATIGYQHAVVNAQQRAVQRYTVGRQGLARLQDQLGSRKDAAMAQRDVVIARRAELETLRAEQDAVRRAVRDQEDRQRALAAEAQARVAEFEAQITALRAESGAIATVLQGIQAGQSLPVGGSGILASPLPGARLTSSFGPRAHPVLGGVRMHDGIDFGAGRGTPIRAAAAGTVVFAGPRGGYGNTVIIDHGNSLATLYAHQDALYVVAGAPVTAGQQIGAVGSTGLSTGPHLHFETRVAGAPVDPLLYL